MTLTYRQVDLILQWNAVAFTLLGAVLTSAGELDPWNVFMFFTGTILWVIWAVRIGSLSLIAVNVGLAVVYAGGVVRGIIDLLK